MSDSDNIELDSFFNTDIGDEDLDSLDDGSELIDEDVIEETPDEEPQEETTDEETTTDEDSEEAEEALPETDDEESDDEESDAEEVAEESEPEPVAEDKPKDKKSIQVPKARLDQEIKKRRELENRLKELESKVAPKENQPAQPELDLKEMASQLSDAVLDNNPDAIASLLENLTNQTYQRAVTDIRNEIPMSPEQYSVQKQVENKAAELEAMYPQFSPEAGEVFDEGLLEEALLLTETYQSRGYDPVQALELSVDMIARREGLTPANAEQEAPKSLADPVRQEKRKVAQQKATKQKLEKLKKQPVKEQVASPQESDDYANVDISKLSDDEFDALPKSVQDRLLGNVF